MRLDEVVRHFLMDVKMRSRSPELTLVSYDQRLGVLVQLLERVGVADLEVVTVLHLRQCVEYLMSSEFDTHRGRKRIGETLSVVTVCSYIRVWKVFFNWCYQEELLESNPVNRLKPPKAPILIKPSLAREHVEKMLAVCDLSMEMGFRDYVILLLLFDTGIRVSEAAKLRVSNIHDDFIKVDGKGRKEREVGIHPEVSKLLWKYVHKYRHAEKSDGDSLFIGREGALGSGGIRAIIRRIRFQAGLKDVRISAHVFRHTFAKMYLERGGDLFRLSREMGHSSIQITKIYLEDFGSTEARREHTAYSPIENISLKKKSRKKKRQD